MNSRLHRESLFNIQNEVEFCERGDEKKSKKRKLQSCLPPEKERGLIFFWAYMHARAYIYIKLNARVTP